MCAERFRALLERVAALPGEGFERVCTWTIAGPMVAAEIAAVLTANAWALAGGLAGWPLAAAFVYARYRARPVL